MIGRHRPATCGHRRSCANRPVTTLRSAGLCLLPVVVDYSFLSSSLGWTCCCCCIAGCSAGGGGTVRAEPWSCSSAKRSQVSAIATKLARASLVDTVRANARHSCARRRYSSALARVMALALVCTATQDNEMGVRAVPQIRTVFTGTTRTFEHASSARFARGSANQLRRYPTVTTMPNHCDHWRFQHADR